MNNNERINLLVDLVKLILIILIVCVPVSIIVLVVSNDSWTTISNFFLGPFTSLRRVGNIIEAVSSLMFTALTVITIFSSGQFSMTTEGSFFIGVTGVMIVVIACKSPGGIHPAVAILFGGLCSALAALIPAPLRMKRNMSELATSIMFNYVAQFLAIHMVSYHFREVNSSNLASLEFEKTSKLPVVPGGTRIHAGAVLGIMLCILVWFFLYRTSLKIKPRVTGDNPLFTKHTGLRVASLMVATWVIIGATAGMGGGVELLGMYNRFKWTTTSGYGQTGAVVALLARSNPLPVPLAATFTGYLNVGADIMARSSDVGREVVGIIRGVMMLLIVVDAPSRGWRQHLIAKAAEAEEEEAMQAWIY